MKISLLTVVTMIPFFLSASTESTSLRGGSTNHEEDDLSIDHRALEECVDALPDVSVYKYFARGKSNEKKCSWITKDEKNMARKCKKSSSLGVVYDLCPFTCAKVGLGPCATYAPGPSPRIACNRGCRSAYFAAGADAEQEYLALRTYANQSPSNRLVAAGRSECNDDEFAAIPYRCTYTTCLVGCQEELEASPSMDPSSKPSASPSSQPNSTPSESPSSKPSDSPSTSIPVGKTKYSPKEIAKAWKEYDNGTYEEDCANAMAIALGEGLPTAFASPLHYICSPDSPNCEATSRGCLEEPCWSGFMTLDEFLDAPVFDINQTPYDGQLTLGPWQTTTTVLHTDDISVRVGETVDYLTNLCNPRCPGTEEASQCTPNVLYPERPLTTIFDGDKIKWCGCAATTVASPELQTLGYSGRCSHGAADHYTKYTHSEYHSIANQICDSV